MKPYEMQNVLDEVQYKDWEFFVFPLGDGEADSKAFLRVQFMADGKVQKGRKWLLSSHMTKSEIVQTAMKAVLTALEHEAREEFTYKGETIFGPHFDVEALCELAKVKREDRRELVGVS